MLDHVGEFADILKAAINRGKADIGDVIEMAEFVHDFFAELLGGDLAVAGAHQLLFEPVQRHFDVVAADRAFFERLQHAGAQLLFVEVLAAAVALDHARQGQLGHFEGREAFLAYRAFAAAANLVAFIR